MAHFQLFAWFGQTLLVRKMGKKSKLFILDTFGFFEVLHELIESI